MVVMFLAYSGYGIMEAMKSRPESYASTFMRKRVIKTWVNFMLAVALFAVLALGFGHEHPLRNWVLCWTGWESIGNSNWFVFDILMLYVCTWPLLRLTHEGKLSLRQLAWATTGVSAVLTLAMMTAKGTGQFWWWDTLLGFPAGMLWSAYKTEIERKLRPASGFILAMIIFGGVFITTYWLSRNYKYVFAVPCAIFFVWTVLTLTTRLRFGNKALVWLGIYSFWIYILQRAAYLTATEFGLSETPVLFMAVCIPATLLLSLAYAKTTARLWTRKPAISPTTL